MANEVTGPEIKVKYTVDNSEVKKGNQEVIDSTKKVGTEVEKSGRSFEKYRDMIGKAAAFMGGAFVTAALAVGKAVMDANEQVERQEKSLRLASGSAQNYARNQTMLQGIADKYQRSVFMLAEGYNQLTRETRGTANEGQRTAQVFDDLTVTSGKMGYSVSETTDHFSAFVDKMKQGTVDSTHLTDELDKRLYEAFLKVAGGMKMTAGELNELLKDSDHAVANVLPQLSTELKNSLGDIPQQDARELGDSIEYAKGKLTSLLDGLFQTSGAKSSISKATDEVGSLIGLLDKVNRNHGLMAAGGVALSTAAIGLVNSVSHSDIQLDPFGYRSQAEAEGQRKALSDANYLGMNNVSQYKLPSKITPVDFDAAEKANAKLIAAAKKAAAERKRELDEISRQEIQESNERIREGIRAAEAASEQKYSKYNGTLAPMGMAKSTGIVSVYNPNTFSSSDQFAKPVTGDGSATNLNKVAAGLASISKAGMDAAAAMRAANAASAEMSLELESLNLQLKEIEKQGKIELFAGVAEQIGQIAVKTGSIEDVGDRIAAAFGEMIQQTGRAIIAYGVTMTGLKKALEASFSNGYVAIAVGAAAVIAGSALKAAAIKNQEKAQARMWDGGIAGTDRIPTLLTPGEMVLTQKDQFNLLGMIRGSNTGTINSPAVNFAGAGGKATLLVEVNADIRHSSIHLSNKKGEREYNYFR